MLQYVPFPITISITSHSRLQATTRPAFPTHNRRLPTRQIPPALRFSIRPSFERTQDPAREPQARAKAACKLSPRLALRAGARGRSAGACSEERGKHCNRDKRERVDAEALNKVAREEKEKRRHGKAGWWMKACKSAFLFLCGRSFSYCSDSR